MVRVLYTVGRGEENELGIFRDSSTRFFYPAVHFQWPKPIQINVFSFAAKPTPWTYRSCCCFVLLLLLGLFSFLIFFPKYGNTYRITFLDNIDVINCANFGNICDQHFAKTAKNYLTISPNFQFLTVRVLKKFRCNFINTLSNEQNFVKSRRRLFEQSPLLFSPVTFTERLCS